MSQAKGKEGTASPLGDALALFDRWLELPEIEQQAELDRVRLADPKIHERLLALIRADADADAGHFLDGSAIADAMNVERGPADEATMAAGPGRIGPWTLERSLGSGGMGRVWLARRHDGLFEGSVAIKMLRESSADEFAVERFAREGQILARLAHANIARLLDAGTLADGQRYLVIEYVEGERIDSFCDARRLDIPARVRLFLQVCEAIVHAHNNLVVHRDLKPANVLVMADGQVKLLDFGVAKLIEGKTAAGEQSPLTQVAGAGLTPEYAAPEQVEGGVITTATDVYSLGMVLYRLLSGSRPYGSDGASPARLARDIVDTEARPLSASVGEHTVVPNTRERAEKRATSPERLRRILRGDLENILSKTLRKKPSERYASVRALMDDLERYLANKPVSARPDRIDYRVGKFVRRHWIGVAASTAVVMAIVAGVVGVVWQARIAIAQEAEARRQAVIAREQALLADSESTKARAEAVHAAAEEARAKEQQAIAERYRIGAQQEARRAKEQEDAATKQSQLAKAEAAKAKATRDFMVDIFRTNLPSSIDIEKAQQLTARELLENGARSIGVKFANEPEVRADLLDIVGELFFRLGDQNRARQLTEERIVVLDKMSGHHDSDKLASYRDMGYLAMAAGDVPALRQATEQAEPLVALGGQFERPLSAVRYAWAELYHDPDKALGLGSEALTGIARFDHISKYSNATAAAYETTARAQAYLGRYDLALAAAEASYSAVRHVASVDRFTVVLKSALIAEMQAGAQMKVQAAVGLRAARDNLVRTLGRRHPDTLAVQAKLGAVLHAGPNRDEGMDLLIDAVRQASRSAHRNLIEDVQMNIALAKAYFDEGRFRESEEPLVWALTATRDKPDLRLLHASGLIAMSRLQTAKGDDGAAIAAAEDARRVLVAALGERSPLVAEAWLALIEAQAASGQVADARELLSLAERIPEATGRRFAIVKWTRELLEAEMRLYWGEKTEAAGRVSALLAQAEEGEDASYRKGLIARALLDLGRALMVSNRLVEAQAALRRAVELRRQLGPLDSPWLAQVNVALADCLITQGESPEAARLLAEAEAAFARQLPLGRQFLYPLQKVRHRL